MNTIKSTQSRSKTAHERSKSVLRQLEAGKPASMGVPQSLEATAVHCDHCSRQMRMFAQAIVRPDLDSTGPKATALASIKELRRHLERLENLISPSRLVQIEPYEMPKFTATELNAAAQRQRRGR